MRVDPRNSIVLVTRRGSGKPEVTRFTSERLTLDQGVLSEALTLLGRPDEWRDHLRRHVVSVRLCEHIYQEATQHRWRARNSDDELIGEPRL